MTASARPSRLAAVARTAIVSALTVASVGLGGCGTFHAASPAPAPEAATLFLNPEAAPDGPVGVFDRTQVLVAYYRSRRHEGVMQALSQARAEALARGDQVRVLELDAQGAALQETAHRQLTGAAPLTNVAEALTDELPQIARQAGVARIVARSEEPAGAQAIDVTADIVARLPAK